MILVSVYHMILTGETFNPSDYESFMNSNPKKPSNFTVQSGFDTSSTHANL